MSHHPPKEKLHLQREYLARLETGNMKVFSEGVDRTAEAIREVKKDIDRLEVILRAGPSPPAA
jgi:hypothetical protein